MIQIKNLEIINKGTALAIDVETQVGYHIESLLFWSVDNFKDYLLAVDLSSELEQINNKEVLIIPASKLGVSKIEDMVFVEIQSTEPAEDGCDNCSKPVLGIAYDLSKYYRCLMAYILDGQSSECNNCKHVENGDFKIAIAINMLIDTISKSIDAGFYQQAISLIEDLKSLCRLKDCKNCAEIECKTCNQFKQS